MAPLSGKDELRALLALINNSVHAILASDTNISPLNSTDSSEADSSQDAQIALAACAQMIALLEGSAAVGRLGMSFHVTACIRVAIEAHVAEAIRERGGGEGLHVTEIAKASTVNPAKLARVLRLLASQHIFRETAEDTFANNKISVALDTLKPLSSLIGATSFHSGTNGVPAFLCYFGDEGMKGSSFLAEQLLDPATANSETATSTAFTHAHGTELSQWDWFNEVGNEWRLERFGVAMKGTDRFSATVKLDVVNGFPFHQLADQAKVVDVGGGVGSVSLALTKAFPHLRLVVQDQASVLEGEARSFWAHEDSTAFNSGRATLQGHNFFEPQPVQDASVFVLRFVVHIWPDAQAETILKHLRDAAQPKTKLIVLEQIVQPLCPADQLDTVDVAGASEEDAPSAPLLPNGGATLAYLTDMTVLTGLNAKERTLAQFARLGELSGWKLERVYRPAGGVGLRQIVFGTA